MPQSDAKEYIIAVQSVIDKFANADFDTMLKAINTITVQSLKEVGHE